MAAGLGYLQAEGEDTWSLGKAGVEKVLVAVNIAKMLASGWKGKALPWKNIAE